MSAADHAAAASWDRIAARIAAGGSLDDISSTEIWLALRWNDPNGDYDSMCRAELLAAFRIQQEYSK